MITLTIFLVHAYAWRPSPALDIVRINCITLGTVQPLETFSILKIWPNKRNGLANCTKVIEYIGQSFSTTSRCQLQRLTVPCFWKFFAVLFMELVDTLFKIANSLLLNWHSSIPIFSNHFNISNIKIGHMTKFCQHPRSRDQKQFNNGQKTTKIYLF